MKVTTSTLSLNFSVEQRPEVRYEIHKTNGILSPSVSEKTVHDTYRKVQKGGDIPLEGLCCPIPPIKGIHCYSFFIYCA